MKALLAPIEVTRDFYTLVDLDANLSFGWLVSLPTGVALGAVFGGHSAWWMLIVLWAINVFLCLLERHGGGWSGTLQIDSGWYYIPRYILAGMAVGNLITLVVKTLTTLLI